jgi:hypothetical protein
MLSTYIKEVDERQLYNYIVIAVDERIPYSIGYVLLQMFKTGEQDYLLKLDKNAYIGIKPTFKSRYYYDSDIEGISVYFLKEIRLPVRPDDYGHIATDRYGYRETYTDVLERELLNIEDSDFLRWEDWDRGGESEQIALFNQVFYEKYFEYHEMNSEIPTIEQLMIKFDPSLPNTNLDTLSKYSWAIEDKLVELIDNFNVEYQDTIYNGDFNRLPQMKFRLTAEEEWTYKEIGAFYSVVEDTLYKFRIQNQLDIDFGNRSYHMRALTDSISVDEDNVVTLIITFNYDIYNSEDYFAYMGPGYYRTFVNTICEGNFSQKDLEKWIEYFDLYEEEFSLERVCERLRDLFSDNSDKQFFIDMENWFEEREE